MESLFNDNPELKKQLVDNLTEEQLENIVCKNQALEKPTFHQKMLHKVHLINCILDQLPSEPKPTELIEELEKRRRQQILVENDQTRNLLKEMPVDSEVWNIIKEGCDELIKQSATDGVLSDKDILTTNEIYNICLQSRLRQTKKELDLIEKLNDLVETEKEKKKNNSRALLIVVIVFVLIGLGVIGRMIWKAYTGKKAKFSIGGMLRSPSFHHGVGFAQNIYE